MTFSQFTAFFNANKRFVPGALRSQIAREATARVRARWADGYGASPLCFRDLAERVENSISPAGKVA